jgi:hypothetical protein
VKVVFFCEATATHFSQRTMKRSCCSVVGDYVLEYWPSLHDFFVVLLWCLWNS